MSAANDPIMLDGNAAAGILARIFAEEAMTARAVCGACAMEGAMAEANVYGGRMAYVLRCRGCSHVLLRATETPAGLWLDMQGVRRLVFARP
ncbi:MAG: DUF6510 family protein [Hyphomicrobiales bacterium]|nr:DUF6510 family protein [Hyphomicrobiales bacterium]